MRSVLLVLVLVIVGLSGGMSAHESRDPADEGHTHFGTVHMDGTNNPEGLPFAVKAAHILGKMGVVDNPPSHAASFEAMEVQCKSLLADEIDYFAFAEWFISTQKDYEARLDEHYRDIVNNLSEADRHLFDGYERDLRGIDHRVIDFETWLYAIPDEMETTFRSRCESRDFPHDEGTVRWSASSPMSPDQEFAACGEGEQGCPVGIMVGPGWQSGDPNGHYANNETLEQFVRRQLVDNHGYLPTAEEVASVVAQLEASRMAAQQLSIFETAELWEESSAALRELGVYAQVIDGSQQCSPESTLHLAWPRYLLSREYKGLKFSGSSGDVSIQRLLTEKQECAQEALSCHHLVCWSEQHLQTVVVQLLYEDAENKYALVLDDIPALVAE